MGYNPESNYCSGQRHTRCVGRIVNLAVIRKIRAHLKEYPIIIHKTNF